MGRGRELRRVSASGGVRALQVLLRDGRRRPACARCTTCIAAEAEACLAAGLVLPAHDYVLKCSHAFNMLDTRGAIGVAERQAFFRRMRDLARGVAEAYVEQRQELEYPLLNEKATKEAACSDAAGQPSRAGGLRAGDRRGGAAGRGRDAPAWRRCARPSRRTSSTATSLAHEEVKAFGTPRRLVVHVTDWRRRGGQPGGAQGSARIGRV